MPDNSNWNHESATIVKSKQFHPSVYEWRDIRTGKVSVTMGMVCMYACIRVFMWVCVYPKYEWQVRE